MKEGLKHARVWISAGAIVLVLLGILFVKKTGSDEAHFRIKHQTKIRDFTSLYSKLDLEGELSNKACVVLGDGACLYNRSTLDRERYAFVMDQNDLPAGGNAVSQWDIESFYQMAYDPTNGTMSKGVSLLIISP
jgi:hypothetical protein